MIAFQKVLNVLFLYVICAVLLSAYLYQYVLNEEPCPLCLLQRLAMLGIGVSLFMNLRFGIKVQHYGLAILSALLGRIVALRHIGIHVCPEFPEFGKQILGLDLYIWSYIVFTCSIFAVAVLLILKGFSKSESFEPIWGFWGKLGFWLLFFLALSNAVTTYLECGWTICIP